MEILKPSSVEDASENEKRQSLYPERPSEVIGNKIALLADFEAGRIEKIPLVLEEREEIQNLENVLGATFEKIFEIDTREAVFYAEYFLTEEGKKDFESMVGVPLGNTEESVQAIERSLYESVPLIKKLDAKKRVSLTGRSRDYSEKFLLEQCLRTSDARGYIITENINAPTQVQLLLSPEQILTKIVALKRFKEKIKQYTDTPDASMMQKSEGFNQVLSGVLELYQSRVNAMLAENRSDVLLLKRKVDVLGEDSLTEDERALFSQMVGTQNAETNIARYDKFLFGATSEYDARGQRNQVGQDLGTFADQFEEEYVSSVVLRNEQIKRNGLNPDKIADKTLSIDVVEKLAEETLRSYGILSEHPASEYTPDRSGPAPDNKWQFIARDEFKTMAVDGKKKIIKCGRGNQSIANLIPITLAHEIEGHVLQNENKSKIPLRLFDRMGSGRSVIFSECGAMNNQDIVSKDAFGYASPPHPHYIRAMQKKLEGGNYLDCVKAFYESSLKATRLQKELGKISDQAFEKKCEEDLKLAINRTKRLFRRSTDLSSAESSLLNSKDTVYLEQVKLFQELKKHGLEKYVFVGGANLDTLLFLMKSGFLHPGDIKAPEYHSLEIWKQMKDDYRA